MNDLNSGRQANKIESNKFEFTLLGVVGCKYITGSKRLPSTIQKKLMENKQ
jgi:hypothetical protein